MGITKVLTAPQSPWQNAFAERLVGSTRHECLDQMIVLGEKHLRRILKSYFDYSMSYGQNIRPDDLAPDHV
jgi:transposase InsO family protein